ncbi:MAG: hypothetical protein ACLRMJ_11450 [Alistipes finegoldii]
MLITGLNGPVNGWNFGNIGGTYLRKYLDPDLENNWRQIHAALDRSAMPRCCSTVPKPPTS